jgi:hypothetical protein
MSSEFEASIEALAKFVGRIQIGAPLVGSPDGVLRTDEDARQFFAIVAHVVAAVEQQRVRLEATELRLEALKVLHGARIDLITGAITPTEANARLAEVAAKIEALDAR